MAVGANDLASLENQKILRNIAEDLKAPLLQILNEISLLKMTATGDVSKVAIIADAAIRLVDSYVLSTKINNGQQQLGFEPVSAGAIMQDIAKYYAKFANLRGCDLRVKSSSRNNLIMAHREVLSAALTSITYGMMSSSRGESPSLELTVRTVNDGIEIGAMSNAVDFSAGSLSRLRSLKGNARQLAPELIYGSSSGIAIADTLLEAMHAPLRVMRRGGKTGLFAVFVPSQQLTLV